MNRHRFLAALVAGALAALNLTACGAGTPQPPTKTQAAAPASRARAGSLPDVVAHDGLDFRLIPNDNEQFVPLDDIVGACASIHATVGSEAVAVTGNGNGVMYVDALCTPLAAAHARNGS